MKFIPLLWSSFQRGYFDLNPDVIVYLKFSLIIESVELSVPRYSEYQQFLYDTISDFRKQGWTFRKISDWLNENGHQTLRGKVFTNAHVHSILKNKSIRDDRMNQDCKTTLSKFELVFEDRTFINKV